MVKSFKIHVKLYLIKSFSMILWHIVLICSNQIKQTIIYYGIIPMNTY